MKYRPHRGMLADAMAEVAELAPDRDVLVAHMRAEVSNWYPQDEMPTRENVEVKPYGFDQRIGWDTHIVTVKGNAWGFTDGPLKN